MDFWVDSLAEGGHRIAATAFSTTPVLTIQLPRDNPDIHHFILINAATGGKRQIYRSFARFLCENIASSLVVTYDYRGVGDSVVDEHSRQEENLGWTYEQRQHAYLRRHPEIDIISAWARDQADVLADRSPQVILVGHSVGAHIIPLLNSALLDRVTRVLFIGANSAYYPYTRSPARTLFFFKVLIPFGSWVLGYVPTRSVGICEDIPCGVGRNWATWGHLKRYMIDDPVHRDNEGIYASFSPPIVSVSFSDDELATKKAFEAYLDVLSGARQKVHVHLMPRDVGCTEVGHNGLFRLMRTLTAQPLLRDLVAYIQLGTVQGLLTPRNTQSKL